MKATVAFVVSLFAAAHAGPYYPTTSSTTRSTTATSTASSAAQTHFGQCAGIGWNGPFGCVPPWTCVRANDWFSQCL
ncbi:hypothetical protein FS837_009820 [Tulasnella sp. UAMH 9824]|nr:hypothetical protein FS837_009820 [Tulasnella sp. UAMH 9824]